jgi:uncharacterized protein with ParB-like and HNH nuclease domain
MAELHVSKKSISKLLCEIQGKKFIIPDFQRPYKWNVEKCETLWNDIVNFTETDARAGSDYFLGTIVSYVNEDKNQEIIDGQQRITSFFLLLRSFYRKLEDMPQDDDQVIGLKTKVAPCLWDTDRISGKVEDFTKIHIESLVATEEDNDTFHKILETGTSNLSATDNYSVNYRFFKIQCDEYATLFPMKWKELCVTILTQCIILPIECDTPETALTIFSTLNDRGLPLADSDIFKAQIYKNLESQDKRKEFTTTWKELTQICKQARTSIDDNFRYYTHILRAKSGVKTKEFGLRNFYAEEKYAKLKDENLMIDIMALANFWRYVNINVEPDYEVNYDISDEARRYLHILSCYPNEFWKYPTSVFFLKNQNSTTFDEDFCSMLKELVAFLFAKFIDAPSVNAIKDDIYSSCIAMHNRNELQYRINFNEELLSKKIEEHSSSRISRGLLLLDAYLNPNQTNLIPETFDIEHIFPKKWQSTNYNGWDLKDAAMFLDRFGNKTAFEKKLNIQAGNGYFGVKKQKYALSKISNVLDLSSYYKDEWVKEDIEKREAIFKDNLLYFFKIQLK